MSLTIKDKNALYAAYMGFLPNGGLFIPTNREYELGDEVFMLLTLLDEPERIPVAGRIVWITPRGAEGYRSSGVGVQFSDEDEGKTRSRIETHLAGMLQLDRPTHTL